MQAALVGFLSAVVAAGAVAMTQKSTVSFADLDKDGDGRISVAEATAHRKLSRSFVTVDVNRDDYISEREFLNWVDSQATSSHRSSEPRLELEDREQAAILPPRTERW